MYNFLMQNDPVLGKNTFGQLARFGPERCYVMHKKLSDLESYFDSNDLSDLGADGWKKFEEFQPFLKSLRGIGTDDCGIDYFKKVIAVFFERFRYVFEKHMGAKWRNSDTLHYMLVGDGEHAQQLAQWLVDYKERRDAHAEAELGLLEEELLDPAPFEFRDIDVTLGKHHQMSEEQGPVVVNLRESMEYITSEADREIILNDAFVERNWTLIESLAASEKTVHLFTKDKDGKIDKSSWGGVDYEQLIVDAWRSIMVHSSHQQRCENYVQLTGLLSKTGVAEVRRSCRAIMIGALIRRFNAWALREKHKMQQEAGKGKDDLLKKLGPGSDKTYLYLKYSDMVFVRGDRGKRCIEKKEVQNGETPGSKWKGLWKRLGDSSKKASASEVKTKLNKFKNSLKRKPKVYKAELPAGIEKTGRVGDGAYLRLMTKTNDMEDAVDAEIKARGIRVSNKKLSDKKLKSLTIAEKRKLLRKDELKKRIDEALTEKEVTYIKPVSKEMLQFLSSGKQQTILDKEAGILSLYDEHD